MPEDAARQYQWIGGIHNAYLAGRRHRDVSQASSMLGHHAPRQLVSGIRLI
jgi:hypothetical protein